MINNERKIAKTPNFEDNNSKLGGSNDEVKDGVIQWNVDMDFMFSGAFNFSQDLSDWCVTNIPSKPTSFDSGSALQPEQLPKWKKENSMTIAEAIQQLQQYDPNQPLYVTLPEHQDNMPIRSITLYDTDAPHDHTNPLGINLEAEKL